MNEDFQKIIDELISFGYRHVDIASKTGLAPMTVYRWQKGEIKNPVKANREVMLKFYKREKAKREVQ